MARVDVVFLLIWDSLLWLRFVDTHSKIRSGWETLCNYLSDAVFRYGYVGHQDDAQELSTHGLVIRGAKTARTLFVLFPERQSSMIGHLLRICVLAMPCLVLGQCLFDSR